MKHRLDKYKIQEEDRDKIVSELIKEIAQLNLNTKYSPEIARIIFSRLKEISFIQDPYKKEKEESNRLLMLRYKEFSSRVNNSDDKFNKALRFAIAGNIIDFGPNQEFNIDETIDKVMNTEFAIDHSVQLKTEIKKASTILYLADNSGEIVLDKLFLETIKHPNVWVAYRGAPVLNDVTITEIIDVGIDKIAKIISNGDDAPSTLLHRVSDDFLNIYHSADLIISKGMGNFEGLMFETDPRIFYLLMIKCQTVGNKIGAQKGTFVVKQNL